MAEEYAYPDRRRQMFRVAIISAILSGCLGASVYSMKWFDSHFPWHQAKPSIAEAANVATIVFIICFPLLFVFGVDFGRRSLALREFERLIRLGEQLSRQAKKDRKAFAAKVN